LAELKSMLRNVVTITLAYEKYKAFEPSAPTLHAILMARHCVLHDLLTIGDSLSHQTDLKYEEWSPDEATLYDLAWLATLSYMVLDLHPCTRGPGPHELLAERLEHVIKRAQEQDLQYYHAVLYQWADDLRQRLNAPPI
jgi:hypothetical protein